MRIGIVLLAIATLTVGLPLAVEARAAAAEGEVAAVGNGQLEQGGAGAQRGDGREVGQSGEM